MSGSAGLLTDLYQLTMAHVYHEREMNETAVFELSVRRLPARRSFLLAAGLAQALEYLQDLRFSAPELHYLEGLGNFPASFIDRLANLRFTGRIHAMPEGTPFFANEPILRVTAPLLEAQLIESRLMNIIHFQTLIASKAVRCVLAARGRAVIDFGMRRAHEADAALFAARATHLAGFAATATVEAGRRFGIPLSGTMAHSYIEAHESEAAAFRDFVATRPAGATLLIDTYDTERAARRVLELAASLRDRPGGGTIAAVRIDSGDLGAQARSVRRLFDAGGCPEIRIILSGGLDEYAIHELVESGAPVDAFGVGTAVDVSADAPSLDIAYKLQAYAGKPRRKRSPGKETWPGAKQVFRSIADGGGRIVDRVALIDESPAGVPLLAEFMRDGRCIRQPASLGELHRATAAQLDALPGALRGLEQSRGEGVSVEFSAALHALVAQMDAVPG